jgi:hypothetical protein
MIVIKPGSKNDAARDRSQPHPGNARAASGAQSHFEAHDSPLGVQMRAPNRIICAGRAPNRRP